MDEDEGGEADVYEAVHGLVTRLLSKNDIETDLVSKLRQLIGQYMVNMVYVGM